MNKPLLSICILTYNHPQDFARLMRSLTSQINKNPNIEIVIRDDSSNDETEKIVKDNSSLVNIRYFKGKKLGFDRAVMFLLENANGDYVWFWGDNDVMTPGTASHIISLLKKYPEISFIWPNFKVVGYEETAVNLGEDRFFRDNNEVLEKVANFLGFITGIFLKREKALSGITGAQKFLDTEFIGIYLAMHVLSQEGRAYFLKEPSIICHPTPPEQHFYDGFSVFAVHYFNIVKSFEGKFRRKSIKKMLAKNFANVWRGILVTRGKGLWYGLGSPSTKVSVIAKLYWNFYGFWVALPFLLLPRFIERPIYRFYKLFFSHRKLRFLNKS